MINGYVENLELPWEERIGNKIQQTIGDTIEDLIINKERVDKNNLITTIIKGDEPFMIDTYVTYDSGALKKVTNQFPGENPHWIYQYFYSGDVTFIRRTNPKGKNWFYKMTITEKNDESKVMRAEYREAKTDKITGRINVERDDEGNLKKEIFEDDNHKAIIKCDKEGRWLIQKQFENKKPILIQEYLR